MRRVAGLVAALLVATVLGAAPASAAEPGWRVVSAGGDHTCGVRTDLTLWCWGFNGDGALGTGDDGWRLTPGRVGDLGGWDTVRAGAVHTCALRRDGSLWCWGSNSRLALGVKGAATRPAPTRVDEATDWKELATGRRTTCAIKRDRTLWCWGTSLRGALGQGAGTTEVGVPTRVGTASSWTGVAAGDDHVCGTQHDRSLWCWGSGASGQLGLGESLADRWEPTRVGTATGWTGVSAGALHTCAIRTLGPRTDRTLWCWGRDRSGELGLGEPSPRIQFAPARVVGARSYLSVAAGPTSTCAARADGSLWCWGEGSRIGLPLAGSHPTRHRVAVPGATGRIEKLTAGRHQTCAIDTARHLWCWGRDHTTPTPVA